MRRMRVGTGTPVFVGAAALVLLLACGGGGGGGGSASASGPGLMAPSSLVYASNPAVYTKGLAITPNVPTSAGGAVSTYAVTPTLPAGLSLNAANGLLSGTPSVLAPAASYTVTASNAAGSTSTALTLTVNDQPPANLTYANPSAVYTKGLAISPNTPSSSGGAVVSWGVSPALPAGLLMDPTTGVISGTPTVLSGTASFTVTATNSGGSATTVVTLAVVDLPPTNLAYSQPSAVYIQGVPISPNLPSSSGGAVIAYSVTPTLPAGLNFSTTTGAITGTPAAASPSATYTIQASNSGGTASTAVVLEVREPAAGLAYAVNPAVYTRGQAITPNAPTNGGYSGFSVTPVLPAGLSLDAASGVITGTPTGLAPATTYQVAATGPGGLPASVSLQITVNDVPPLISYGSSTFTFTTGVAVNLVPTNTGGPVVSWTISPGLPAGLSFNNSTGAIAGTPSAITGQVLYSIVGNNTGGSSSVAPWIRVNPPAPKVSSLPYLRFAKVGEQVSFSVTATGTGPLTYQWFKGQSSIPGATSSTYNIPSVSNADNGSRYSLTVRDGYGNATDSSQVLLRVIPPGFSATGALETPRTAHTATLLSNGKVLITGGVKSNLGTLRSCEVYDPATGAFTPTGSLHTARADHMAVLLPDGKVHISGGTGVSNEVIDDSELYDPSTGQFTVTTKLKVGRAQGLATLLQSGKVLIAGGYVPSTAPPSTWSTAELYHPATQAQTFTGNLFMGPRTLSTIVPLENGNVLILGGYSNNALVEAYSPSTAGFTLAGALNKGRGLHTSTLMGNDKILVFGGSDGVDYLAHPEVYDPATGSSTAVSAALAPRFGHAASVLPDGGVLIFGGRKYLGSGQFEYLSDAWRFDPASGTFASMPPMISNRAHFTCTVLQDGTLLVVGGSQETQEIGVSELYR